MSDSEYTQQLIEAMAQALGRRHGHLGMGPWMGLHIMDAEDALNALATSPVLVDWLVEQGILEVATQGYEGEETFRRSPNGSER